jgi:hypothetical protein
VALLAEVVKTLLAERSQGKIQNRQEKALILGEAGASARRTRSAAGKNGPAAQARCASFRGSATAAGEKFQKIASTHQGICHFRLWKTLGFCGFSVNFLKNFS